MIALALLLAAPALADVTEHPYLIGIVEVPKVFGKPDPKGPPGSKIHVPGEVVVYAQPEKRKWPPPKKADAAEDLAHLEYLAEQPGAVVFWKRRGWYQVKTKDGKEWITSGDAGEFHPLEDLVLRGLAYMTPAWHFELRDKPKTDAPARRLRLGDEAEPGAQVLGSKKTKEGLWLHVRVLSTTGCTGDEPKTLDTGWVPAHNEEGQVNVWFFSRGC